MSFETVIDRPRGKMVLADGTRFGGYLIGAQRRPLWGEVVFNTSMTGYQEVITDPSYAGQIIVMTYPQIGNYGVSAADSERDRVAARALVVRDLSEFFSPGPGRRSLEEFMVEQGLCGLAGVDTRAVTRRIRSGGVTVAAIGNDGDDDEDLASLARSKSLGRGESLVSSVSGGLSAPETGGGVGRVAIVDLGVKAGIVEHVSRLGVDTVIFDKDFKSRDVLSGAFDFVVLSNGPGDPTDVPDVVEQVRGIIGRIPILGICLGHQLVALAIGASTYKLRFGHHGANQPVVDRRTGRVFITSQNHNYAVDSDLARGTDATVTYVNAGDGTLEGFVDEERWLEGIQFHPEASPGPRDTGFIFEEFFERARAWSRSRREGVVTRGV